MALSVLALGACGRTADAPVVPAAPAVEDVVTPARPPEAPRRAWLVWRQDVGGMGVTSLLEENPAGSAVPYDALSVNKALIVLGAGDAWTLGPVTERWGLKPCGADGIGIAMGLRYQKLGLATAKDLPSEAVQRLWSTADKRPSVDESAMHDEALAFVAQVRDQVFVKHVTTGGTCPVPAEGNQTEVELLVLDFATNTLREPMSLLADDEKVAVEKNQKGVAVFQIARKRPDLAPALIGEHLHLEGLAVTRGGDGELVVTYTFGGRADAFRPEGTELGHEGPFELQTTVVGQTIPRALRDPQAGWPAAVASFLGAAAEADKPRADDFPYAGLYGGYGWSEVPPELVERIRETLIDLREAATPTGPTDWD